jgi:hypothetical protein
MEHGSAWGKCHLRSAHALATLELPARPVPSVGFGAPALRVGERREPLLQEVLGESQDPWDRERDGFN